MKLRRPLPAYTLTVWLLGRLRQLRGRHLATPVVVGSPGTELEFAL